MSDPTVADVHLTQTSDPQQIQNLPHPQDYSQMHPTDRLQHVMQATTPTPNSQPVHTIDPLVPITPAVIAAMPVGTNQNQNAGEDPNASLQQVGQTQDSTQGTAQRHNTPIQNDAPAEDNYEPKKPGLPLGIEPVGGDKERVELRPTAGSGEKAPVIEVREHERVPEDVQSWIEELEDANEVQIAEPITDDGQVVLDNAVTFKEDKIVLPITQATVQQGMKQQVVESARWLAEWCTRLMKMLGDKVQYKQD